MDAIGFVELHGGKLIVRVDEQIIPIVSTKFIPGDKVKLDKSGATLLLRKEQPAIAIIQSIESNNAKLYIANLGPACPFSPELHIGTMSVKVGDRLVIWLHSNGELSCKALYSSDPLDDVSLLLTMYKTYKRSNSPSMNLYTKSLYTEETIINHNNLNTFTIDPINSVDFDDAISVDVDNNTVYVHIVDIANTETREQLSEESNRRLSDHCLTLYLSNEHTEHLLDTVDTLSLVKGQQRNTITVKVCLNSFGLVDTYEIYRSTIVVKNRYSYEQVTEMLKGQTPIELDYLLNLSNKRSEDVKYHLNLPSVRLDIDKDTGLAKSIHVECTNDPSHNLVATAMVLANLVVSKHLNHCNVKLPNRFHDSLRGFTQNMFTSTNNTLVDSFILVKRYARANYSVDKKGHFGLGLTDYVHFTSPMRRYADVLVHRILAGQQIETEVLQNEVDWLNYRSQMVRSLQDLYTNWKVIRHLEKNQAYTVYVTDIKKTGVLWFMPSMSLNGYSHVSTLKPSQYWTFDKSTLQGLDKQVIRVGAMYEATIISIDPITYTVNLSLNIK